MPLVRFCILRARSRLSVRKLQRSAVAPSEGVAWRRLPSGLQRFLSLSRCQHPPRKRTEVPHDRTLGKHSPSAMISTATVQLVRRYTGRGPTKAKTLINDDLVTVLLADTLTQGERTLVANGRSERVLELRYEFQLAMRDDLVAVVEGQLDRKVIGLHEPEPHRPRPRRGGVRARTAVTPGRPCYDRLRRRRCEALGSSLSTEADSVDLDRSRWTDRGMAIPNPKESAKCPSTGSGPFFPLPPRAVRARARRVRSPSPAGTSPFASTASSSTKPAPTTSRGGGWCDHGSTPHRSRGHTSHWRWKRAATQTGTWSPSPATSTRRASERLEAELRAAEATDAKRIVLDLSGLNFMDSRGLGALLEAQARSRRDSNRLRIVRGPRRIQRVFELTNTQELLPFLD